MTFYDYTSNIHHFPVNFYTLGGGRAAEGHLRGEGVVDEGPVGPFGLRVVEANRLLLCRRRRGVVVVLAVRAPVVLGSLEGRRQGGDSRGRWGEAWIAGEKGGEI